MSKQVRVKSNFSLVDSIKKKVYEAGADYFKSQFEKSKKEIFNHFERRIEKKIKKEIKKMSFKLGSILFLIIGFLTLLYGIFAGFVYFFDLPMFFASIFYGFFLVIVALVVYVLNT